MYASGYVRFTRAGSDATITRAESVSRLSGVDALRVSPREQPAATRAIRQAMRFMRASVLPSAPRCQRSLSYPRGMDDPRLPPRRRLWLWLTAVILLVVAGVPLVVMQQ